MYGIMLCFHRALPEAVMENPVEMLKSVTQPLPEGSQIEAGPTLEYLLIAYPNYSPTRKNQLQAWGQLEISRNAQLHSTELDWFLY